MPDVPGDPLLPGVERLAVAGVDPVGEVPVVQRLAIVVRWRSDERPLAGGNAGGSPPDGELSP